MYSFSRTLPLHQKLVESRAHRPLNLQRGPQPHTVLSKKKRLSSESRSSSLLENPKLFDHGYCSLVFMFLAGVIAEPNLPHINVFHHNISVLALYTPVPGLFQIG